MYIFIMMLKLYFWIILFFTILFSFCNQIDKRRETIDFAVSNQYKDNADSLKSKNLNIAISSMVSPKETYTYYNDLGQFIAREMGTKARLIQKKTYKEVNNLLDNSHVDFAFICSGAYTVDSKKMKIIAVPVVNGKTFYKAYIVTNKNSGINSFDNFAGQSFIYTDPISNTGCFYPSSRVLELTNKPDSFYSKLIYTYAHDIALQMVNRNFIDGASVNSLIFEYIKDHYPDKVQNIRIIEESVCFGIPPVVAPISISDEKFHQLQEIFLSLHEDKLGKKILEQIHIEKFIIGNDSLYDNVRNLKSFQLYEKK